MAWPELHVAGARQEWHDQDADACQDTGEEGTVTHIDIDMAKPMNMYKNIRMQWLRLRLLLVENGKCIFM